MSGAPRNRDRPRSLLMQREWRAIVTTIFFSSLWASRACAHDLPNVVVILTDDQGFADFGFNPHSPPEVSTPHMDDLASTGVLFTQAYTSGNVCSPTRAGLMLGRYQQRVGVYSAGDGGRGIDPTIPIFPRFLPEEYVSTAIGKWHLGLDEDYPELKWHPVNRGFTESYNFMGRGGHDYFSMVGVKGDETSPMYRGLKQIEDTGYLTKRFSEEAVSFIDRHRDRPFFLYLAYNAVHAPAQAPEETIQKYRERFPELSPGRQVLMAMLEHLDLGIGCVVEKLRAEKLFDNTLLFLLTDNGGARGMQASNTPLKGYKSSNYEGGIRTPLIVSWPRRFPGGRTIDAPVISLDILPTALEALGVDTAADPPFDGKSLLPLLTGQTDQHHETLFWDDGAGDWVVRQGAWKLHSQGGRLELVDLFEDEGETRNLAEAHSDRVRTMQALYDAWKATLPPPGKGGEPAQSSSGNGSASLLTPREQKRAETRERNRLLRKGGQGTAPPVQP